MASNLEDRNEHMTLVTFRAPRIMIDAMKKASHP